MEKSTWVPSWYGTRYYMFDYNELGTIPETGTPANELTAITSSNIGNFSKENTTYRTLNGNGWESIAVLGNTIDDAEFSAIRVNPKLYDGTEVGETYNKVKKWFMEATSSGGIASPKFIIEVVVSIKGNEEAVEATLYNVVPSQWNPGQRDTETGQEFSFTVKPFGAPVPLKATYSSETDTWTFSALSKA